MVGKLERMPRQTGKRCLAPACNMDMHWHLHDLTWTECAGEYFQHALSENPNALRADSSADARQTGPAVGISPYMLLWTQTQSLKVYHFGTPVRFWNTAPWFRRPFGHRTHIQQVDDRKSHAISERPTGDCRDRCLVAHGNPWQRLGTRDHFCARSPQASNDIWYRPASVLWASHRSLGYAHGKKGMPRRPGVHSELTESHHQVSLHRADVFDSPSH